MCVKNIKNMLSMVRFSKYAGSVRIQFILLKTENGKHCSKIIFKLVDSAVVPVFIFIFFVVEQSGFRSSEKCTLSLAQ